MWQSIPRCLFILLGTSLFACQATSQTTTAQLLDTAKALLGQEVDQIPNSTGTHILFVQKPAPTASTALKFIIIRASDNEVVESHTFMPGHVKWVTEYTLEVLNVPGTIKSGGDLASYRKMITIASPK